MLPSAHYVLIAFESSWRKAMQTVLETEVGNVPAFVIESESNVALLIIPTMFGIDEDLELLCEDIAMEGFTVIAVDPFWEIDAGPLGHSIEEVRRALARKNELDKEESLENMFAFCSASLQYAKNIVVLGIGYGGHLAYQALAYQKAAAAMTWHATGITDHLTLSGRINRPLSFHFGGEDYLTPVFEIDILREVFRGKDFVSIEVHSGAKHGYSHREELTYNEEALDKSFASLIQLLHQFT